MSRIFRHWYCTGYSDGLNNRPFNENGPRAYQRGYWEAVTEREIAELDALKLENMYIA